MNVLILTLPLHVNYGGIMQAYALREYLKELGHTPYVISVQPQLNLLKQVIQFLKNIIKKYIFGIRVTSLSEKKNIEIELLRRANINCFINSEIEEIVVGSFNEINEIINKYNINAIIVGSDQVWRASYSDSIENYYFSFLLESSLVKRISYAASFGDSIWKYSKRETRICSILLKKMNSVSVREDSGVELCEKYLGSNSIQLIDPTLLFPSQWYMQKLHLFDVDKKRSVSQGLFPYILDLDKYKKDIIKIVSDHLSLKIENNPFVSIDTAQLFPPISSWIESFSKANFVVTDSFHGCVFSIIFHIPFLAINNNVRGNSRLTSLLDSLNLSERMVDSFDSINSDILFEDINWAAVDFLLKLEREKSYIFLREALK